ncbi:MAG: YciI family protein [Actinomycetota bacterium]
MSDKYLIMIIDEEWDSASVTDEQHADAQKAHGAFAAAVAAAGASILGGEALQGPQAGFSVVPAKNGKPAVFTNGPLTETTEVLSGYYVIEADSLGTARELAALCPAEVRIEVRPIWDMVM